MSVTKRLRNWFFSQSQELSPRGNRTRFLTGNDPSENTFRNLIQSTVNLLEDAATNDKQGIVLTSSDSDIYSSQSSKTVDAVQYALTVAPNQLPQVIAGNNITLDTFQNTGRTVYKIGAVIPTIDTAVGNLSINFATTDGNVNRGASLPAGFFSRLSKTENQCTLQVTNLNNAITGDDGCIRLGVVGSLFVPNLSGIFGENPIFRVPHTFQDFSEGPPPLLTSVISGYYEVIYVTNPATVGITSTEVNMIVVRFKRENFYPLQTAAYFNNKNLYLGSFSISWQV